MNAIDTIRNSVYNYWMNFLDHVPNLVLGMIVLVLAFLISRYLSAFFKIRMERRMDDPLLSNFISRILRYTLLILGILLSFHIMGLTGVAGSLLAGAGLGALIIGLAFQDIGANFIAGIILAFNRPFNTGDTIEISGFTGQVVKMNLRTTQIKTFDGKDIYIPNNTIIKEELINYTIDGFIRMNFTVGIDYNEDIEQVRETIALSLKEIPFIIKDEQRKATVFIKELATSTVSLEVKFWLETYDYKVNTAEYRSRVISRVLRDLIKAGVNLPADIIELKSYPDKEFPLRINDGNKRP